MIVINELRILPEHRLLLIDIEVRRQCYYDNVYLNEIKIDTQETFSEIGPSNNTIYEYKADGNCKSIRLELELGKDIPFTNEDCMFFVYMSTKGIPSCCTPRGADIPVRMECVYNGIKLYSKVMQYIRELNVHNVMPKGIIDFVLRFKTLELSIKSRHFRTAIKLWKEFFKKIDLPFIRNIHDYEDVSI